MTEPRAATPPDESTDVAARIEAAGQDVVGVSEGPLAGAVVRLDALHRELQGALADLDEA